jgi:hypothetical protein
MADKPLPSSPLSHPHAPGESKPATGESAALVATPRQMAQRTSDVRDAMAEMAERAQVISQEAGTKIAAAMKDVIGAAAGIAGFAVESARDLVQYMVRRGQMTQDEADKLIREAESAQGRRAPRGQEKASTERVAPKPEAPRESARRDPVPGSANASAKRAAPPAAAAKSEKSEKPAKSEKKPAKGATAAPKKAPPKPAARKRR